MLALVFYEKPGCVGNRLQKDLLTKQGVELEVRNLLQTAWTPESLMPFFGEMAVCDWFNLSAPTVKSGAIRVHDCSQEEALAMMIDDPILIRRPLLQCLDLRQSGFVKGPVLDALGVRIDETDDLQSCPMGETETVCGASP